MARARAVAGHGGFCNVCQHRYRGLYGAHAAGETHRAKAYRQANPRGGSVGRKHAGRVNVRTLHARLEAHDASMVSVKRHRRSRPDDGASKVVPVGHYWREPPYVASRSWPAKPRRRKRKRASS